MTPILRVATAVNTATPHRTYNFLSPAETLDPTVFNFTRGSSAMRAGPAGLLINVGNNVPRFEYDPITLEPKGLLIEEQRTNLCTASEELNLWTTTNATVVANATTAPDGTMTADKIVEDTANGSHGVNRTQSIVTGTVYTVSVYAKAAERTQFRILPVSGPFGGVSPQANYNLSNGTTTSSSGAVSSIEALPNGWYRCIAVLPATTATGTNQVARIFMLNETSTAAYIGNGSSGLFMWGMQLEAGAFATSYIPTNSVSTSTRSADVALIQNYDWHRSDSGSWAVDLLPAGAGIRRLLNTSGTTDGLLSINASNFAQNTNSVTAVTTANAVTAGAVARAVTAYDPSGRSICLNGGDVVSDSATNAAPTAGFRLGSRSDGFWCNSHIRSLRYWRRRLTESEMKAQTL